MKLVFFVGLPGLALGMILGAAHAAEVQDIRIARHSDHIRVVLDLDAPVTFTGDGPKAFLLRGVTGGSAVMNAEPDDAPLERVILTPVGRDARLSFESSEAFRPRTFLTAPTPGNARLVFDLYPAAGVAFAPRPSSSSTSSLAADVPPTDIHAAVPSSMPPQIGPTPFEPTESTSAAAVPPAAATLSAATAPPTNTVPPSVSDDAWPASTASAIPSAAPTAPAQPNVNSPVEDRAIFAERALDRGDAKSACAAADQALRAEPHNLRALVVLGGCRLALGNALAARAAFATAVEGDPSYHRALIGLAEAEAKLGNIAGARRDYARVLADNPPASEAYKIVAAMNALPAGRAPRGRGGKEGS